MARAHVNDETWSAFRAGLGSTPVTVELGRLVERELASRRRSGASDDGAVGQAVDDARLVVDELSARIASLEHTQIANADAAPTSAGSDVLLDA